jgi:PAS domain S-box-containing protein
MKFLYVNQKAAQLLGYKKEELVEMTVGQVSADTNAEGNSLVFNEILKRGNFYTEIELIKRNGRKVAVDLNATLLPDGNIYGSCRDITERLENRRQLIEAKEKAEESDRLKSAFLANMSHEIRTPMNGILGFTELLKENNLSVDRQGKYIDVIQRSGRRMLNTVNDIIDISKIDSGQVSISLSDFNIHEELESLITFFRPQAEEKGINISLSCGLNEEEDKICADKTKFHSIITNLVKNALKYTHDGFIEVGCKMNGDKRLFYVKDTGRGIPPERQEAIFNRFEQADIEDVHALEGSGLGLAISRSYVEMMGGNIWVESEPGEGSVFYFTVASNCDNLKTGVRKPPVSYTGEKPQKKFRVLIAEDDDTSFFHLEVVLAKYAREIIRAQDGIELLEILKSDTDIDLILMDIKMPRMNGYEAAKKTREINKKIPIIAQTAYALPGDKEKALNAGCDDYIEKPINKRILVELITKAIEV